MPPHNNFNSWKYLSERFWINYPVFDIEDNSFLMFAVLAVIQLDKLIPTKEHFIRIQNEQGYHYRCSFNIMGYHYSSCDEYDPRTWSTLPEARRWEVNAWWRKTGIQAAVYEGQRLSPGVIYLRFLIAYFDRFIRENPSGGWTNKETRTAVSKKLWDGVWKSKMDCMLLNLQHLENWSSISIDDACGAYAEFFFLSTKQYLVDTLRAKQRDTEKPNPFSGFGDFAGPLIDGFNDSIYRHIRDCIKHFLTNIVQQDLQGFNNGDMSRYWFVNGHLKNKVDNFIMRMGSFFTYHNPLLRKFQSLTVEEACADEDVVTTLFWNIVDGEEQENWQEGHEQDENSYEETRNAQIEDVTSEPDTIIPLEVAIAVRYSPGMQCSVCGEDKEEHNVWYRLLRCQHEYGEECLSGLLASDGAWRDRCAICRMSFSE